jgi:hypothetical protein
MTGGEGIATYNTFRRYTPIPTWFTVKLNKIVATFKLSKDGGLELFHKEDEESLYTVCRRSANTLRDGVTALYVNITTLLRRINIDAPTTTYL